MFFVSKNIFNHKLVLDSNEFSSNFSTAEIIDIVQSFFVTDLLLDFVYDCCFYLTDRISCNIKKMYLNDY